VLKQTDFINIISNLILSTALKSAESVKCSVQHKVFISLDEFKLLLAMENAKIN